MSLHPLGLSIALLMSIAIARPLAAQTQPVEIVSGATSVSPFQRPAPPLPTQQNDGHQAAELDRGGQRSLASAIDIPLPPASTGRDKGADDDSSANRGPLITVAGSLAIVLGLFCGFVWLSRKANPGGTSGLSSDMFSVLGSSAIDPRHRVSLIRCGQRVLLVSMTAESVTTLTEFTDPDEVTDLIARSSGSAKQAFSQALRAAGDGVASRGFIDQ